MAVEWRQEGLPDTAAFRLEIACDTQIRLDDGRGRQQLLGAKKLSHELCRYGDWMVELIRGDADRELGLRRSGSAERPLRIAFEAGTAEQVAIHRLQAQPESRVYRNVSSVIITGDLTIRVECQEQGPRPSFRDRQPSGPSQQEYDRLFRELEGLRQAAIAARGELEAERIANRELRELLTASGDEWIERLSRERDRLSEALAEKLEKAQTVRQEAREAQARLEEAEIQCQAAEQERAGFQKELDQAEARLEVKRLDCERTQEELNCLRAQMKGDEDTLALMEEEPFLTGNSVRRTLEEIAKKMEAAERRMGQIIALREKINDTVQQAITQGDGVLPIDDELGGGQDGPDKHETADPSAGGTDPVPESGAGCTAPPND